MSEKIKDILLEHCGKKNAITSKQISKSMGFPMEDTQAVSRKEIWKTAEEYGLPVISCGNKGFCIDETDEEMKEAESAAKKLGLTFVESRRYFIPEMDDARFLLIYRKDSKTPELYPRNFSQISKKPL